MKRFGFKVDQLQQTIQTMSGGQKTRLALLAVWAQRPQVLLLDEPTNHLDFETVEALGAALRQFAGTVFFISHDRTFVNMVATEIIEVKSGSVVRYPGSYADYVYRLENQVREELFDEGTATATGKRQDKQPSDFHLRKQAESAQRKLTGQINRCEQKLDDHRRQKDELEAEMAVDPANCTHEMVHRYEEVIRLIEQEEKRWLELNEQLEPPKAES